jgi:hypothetical protein
VIAAAPLIGAGQKLAHVYFEDEPGRPHWFFPITEIAITHWITPEVSPILGSANGCKRIANDQRGCAMRVTRITIVVLWALTMLPLAPLAAKAGVDGFGMHSPPAGGMHSPPAIGQLPPYDPFRHRHHHHRAFALWPWYGSYDVPQYTPDYDPTDATPETVVAPPTPPRVGCQHSEQTVKVPSENGEVREVTILRC